MQRVTKRYRIRHGFGGFGVERVELRRKYKDGKPYKEYTRFINDKFDRLWIDMGKGKARLFGSTTEEAAWKSFRRQLERDLAAAKRDVENAKNDLKALGRKGL